MREETTNPLKVYKSHESSQHSEAADKFATKTTKSHKKGLYFIVYF